MDWWRVVRVLMTIGAGALAHVVIKKLVRIATMRKKR